MVRKPLLSVIVPAYNREKELPLALIFIDRYLSAKKISYEIMVVTGNSTDKTKEIVRRFEKIIKNMRWLDVGDKANKEGWTIRQGVLAARGEWRLIIGTDNAMALEEFNKLIPYLNDGYDILVGWRSNLRKKQKIAMKFLNFWARALFLLSGISDEYCQFKCFSEEAVLKTFPLSRANDISFNLEIMSLAQKKECIIKEVPLSNEYLIKDFHWGVVDYILALCQTFKIRYYLKQCLKDTI